MHLFVLLRKFEICIIKFAYSFDSTVSNVTQTSNRFPDGKLKCSKTNTIHIIRTIPGVMAVELCMRNFHMDLLRIRFGIRKGQLWPIFIRKAHI